MNGRMKFALKYIVASVLLTPVGPKSLQAEPLQEEAQQALLRGDWAGILAVLEKSDIKDADVPCRMVAAHACLATNRNNSSMLLFLSAKESKDIELWLDWTKSLLNREPQNPIALYLSADAEARQGRAKEAIAKFTQALEIKKDFALAFNARGVVKVLNDEWDEALIDFLQAKQCDPKLADAHANLGTYWVVREAPDGAIEAFSKAIELNPEFALVYNGMGCAYFGRGEFERATHYFSVACQLNPILVVAEINQGYASTYASQLVELANLEKKPGTTLESVMQQYSNTLKDQQAQLSRMLPSQRDREFWKKMDALPWILQDDNKTRSLINEYGLQTVQMGAFLKTQEYKGRITETNQRAQDLYSRLRSYDTKIWNVRVAETITSLGFAALGASRDLQKGWEIAQLKTELRIEKGLLSSTVPNQNLKTILDAVPLSLTPTALAASTASSGFKIGRAYLEDRRGAASVEFESLASQRPVLGAQLRSIETNLGRLRSVPIAETSNRLSISSIPGYYTSTDRPLTEIGAIASMVDKSIAKPLDTLSRRALIVGQDSFRSNLQQQELHKYGFETKLVSPTSDIQNEAKGWGANVIIGIKGTSQIELQGIGRIPIDNTSKYYLDDITRKIPPPFPPGGGGGAAGVPKISQPSIQQNWDWGKPFIPTYPKGSPGGISTEELARSFVDKGNWPVLTSFGLLYQTSISLGEKGEEAK